jgi:hypothetical protein
MIKKYRLLIAAVAYLGLSTSAFANYACSGAVRFVGLDAAGQVWVALANSATTHSICNLDTKGANSMLPSACKATYATLMAAKAMGQPVKLYYYDNAYTCETIPSWSNIPEFYFIEQT